MIDEGLVFVRLGKEYLILTVVAGTNLSAGSRNTKPSSTASLKQLPAFLFGSIQTSEAETFSWTLNIFLATCPQPCFNYGKLDQTFNDWF